MAITVKVASVETVKAELREIPQALERAVIGKMAQRAYDEGYKGAESHGKTGRLVSSLYNRAIPKGREVGHDPKEAPHAIFIHFGTRPHKIQPNRRKALRWVSGNGFAFAKEVKHPGYRGDEYLYRAADSAIRQFAAFVDEAIKESR